MTPRFTNYPADAGFSLIELLVVVAIIGLLATFAVPAFSSIGQARGVSEAASLVASAVELARSEAIARQTYVWLGIQPQTNGGNKDLRLGIVYSKDGQANTNTTNLQSIGRTTLIQRVGLESVSALSVGTNLVGATDLSASGSGLTFEIGSTRFTSRQSITFTPLGEVMINPAPGPEDGFDPRLALGLRQARGTTLMNDNDIAVVIDGSVGIPTIHSK